MHSRALDTCLIIEEVVCVELAIPQEVPGAAVELVAAGPGNDIHHRGPAEPNFRAEVGLLHLELLHRVNRRSVAGEIRETSRDRFTRRDTVNLDVGSGVATAVRNKVVAGKIWNIGRGLAIDKAGRLVDTWSQKRQVQRRAANKRQVINESPVDGLAGHRIRRIDQLLFTRDCDALVDGANFQSDINLCALSHVHDYSRSRLRLESGGADGEIVNSRLDVRERVEALVVCLSCKGYACRLAG